MSSGGSGTTEVMAHPWRLVEDCYKHVQLPRETHGRRASSRRVGEVFRASCATFIKKFIKTADRFIVTTAQESRALSAVHVLLLVDSVTERDHTQVGFTTELLTAD